MSQKRNHVKVTHMFTREQAEALRREAYRRAGSRGSRKPDESEIVREAVEEWFSRREGARRRCRQCMGEYVCPVHDDALWTEDQRAYVRFVMRET